MTLICTIVAAMPMMLGIIGDNGNNRQQSTQTAFEKIATNLQFFQIKALYSDRVRIFGVPPETAAAFLNQTQPLREGQFAQKDLIRLLKHDEPRVRTLAAAVLFERAGPKSLPHLLPLVDDEANSFPVPYPFATALFMKPQMVLDKRTVGEYVRRMFREYLAPAGYSYGPEGKHGNPGFADYWAKRKDRKWCASWFYVDLSHASLGISPTRQYRVPHIRKLRKRIDQIPEPDRTFVLLWLSGETGSDALVTEKELIASCKKVGPDKLLKVLQRKIPSDDPDLQPRRSGNYFYGRMVLFILNHAEQLLRAKDADAVLACERWERDYVKHDISDPMLFAEWFTAAAKLQPAKAKQILSKGWERFEKGQGYRADARAELALSWHRHVGKKEMSFVVNWFHNESPQRGQFPHCLAYFIRQIGPKPTLADRKLIRAIIKDRRFDKLDWQSLQQLGLLVNSWEKKPIIAKEELWRTGHPLGMGHFHWEQVRATADYPKETAMLLERLQQWREALREYVEK